MSDHKDQTYASGFKWVGSSPDPQRSPSILLKAPSGRVAATVWILPSMGKYTWHVWDEDGFGGENSAEATLTLAKITAESAVLRWGRHFKTRHPK
jgi:hypothetical protein